jgi:hypothetical protein
LNPRRSNAQVVPTSRVDPRRDATEGWRIRCVAIGEQIAVVGSDSSVDPPDILLNCTVIVLVDALVSRVWRNTRGLADMRYN